MCQHKETNILTATITTLLSAFYIWPLKKRHFHLLGAATNREAPDFQVFHSTPTVQVAVDILKRHLTRYFMYLLFQKSQYG